MTTGRGDAAATRLPNGQVLITGGWSEFPYFLATAELYDPESRAFTATDSMIDARQEHTATLLSNGHVLVAGGTTTLTTSTGESVGQADTNSAELWIPSSTVKQPEPTPTSVPPPARVLTVNKIADTDDGGCDADCSLREAIAAADSGDTIIIPGGTYTLTLGSQLTIDKSLTLSGAGSEDTVIQAAASSADATSRVLMIEGDNSTVTISDVTIRHGNAREAHGGGIFNGATLTLTHTTISSNIATKSGGGFINIGQATIIGSFITGNTSAFWGGGIRNAGTLTISNSTVSGNSAATFGGGINNTSDATFTIVNSTITDNDAGSGGGGIQNSGTLSLTNTIIANNTNRDCSGNPTSLGHNLDSDGTCGLNGAGDKSNVNPKLGPLQDNGGPTFTHALLQGSPAIDAGNPATLGSGANACPATDQREVARPQGPRCDIGAFELVSQAPKTITVTKTGDTDATCIATDCSLREAIAVAISGDTIAIPGTYTLTLGSQLTIDKSLTVGGAGSEGTVIQSATEPGVAFHRVFVIESGATVTISGLTIRHGRVTGFGGGIHNSGTLTLTNSTVSDNIARDPFGGNGGGIFNRSATLALTNSTFSGNTATLQGGGIFSNGTLTITNSTFSGNSASSGGGIASFGTAKLTNSTVSGNSAEHEGGGIYNNGIVEIVNTIVAGNTAPTQPNCNVVTSQGHNLLGDLAGCFRNLDSRDFINVDPMLGPLQDNGGPTFTHALLSGSPATDAGDDSQAPEADQRGVSRPQGLTSDIGAYEFEPTPVPTPISPPAGMVSWWPGDGNANDIVGGNHGALLNGATFADGIVGQAFSFDGPGEYVSIPDSLSLDVSSITVDAWINVRSHDDRPAYNFASRFFVTPGVLAQLSWEFGIRDGKLGAGISSDCIRQHDLIGINTLDIDTWYHVALVIDGTANKARLYLDGQLDQEFNISGFCGTSNTLLQISDGRTWAGIDGRIDEFELFNRALSDAEIKAIFEAGSAGKIKPPEPTPIPVPPPGRVLTVAKTGDTSDGVCDADCSLREAIAAADSGDTIIIPVGIYTLTMGTELIIDKSLTLIGAGFSDTIIEAAALSPIPNPNEPIEVADFRVFNILAGHNVSISSLTIRHGKTTSGNGGGIRNRGTLTLTNAIVSRNFAYQGGGIGNEANLTVTDSTIRGNTAQTPGGGINNWGALTLRNSTVSGNHAHNAGGLFNSGGTITLTNSTISGNTANVSGGGIFNSTGGWLIVTNSTITDNTATSAGMGGGIHRFDGTVTLTNTIIAGNANPNSPDCSGSPTSLGHNLIGDNSGCSFSPSTSDLVNVDALLGPLQDNGGPTLTHALLPGSPAIDAGDDSMAPATDQRGISRPQGAASDIGAYEFEPTPVPTPTPGPAGTVVGRVLWNEQPVEGAAVYVTDLYDFNSTRYGSARTAANGHFSISSILEGDQYLYVFGNQPDFWVSAVTPFEMVSGRGAVAEDTYLCKGFDPISPQSGETIVTGRPLLQWPPYPDAVDYAVRVIRESVSRFGRGDDGPRITETSVQVDVNLSLGEYRWRVDAFNAEGHIIGCSYYLKSNFTVVHTPTLTPTPTPTPTLPPTPTFTPTPRITVYGTTRLTDNRHKIPGHLVPGRR